MEASTSIAPLYRKLVDEGYQVTVSHPRKTRYIAEARIKSDRVDSKALAELLRLRARIIVHKIKMICTTNPVRAFNHSRLETELV